MRTSAPQDFCAALKSIPKGTSMGRAFGTRYCATRSVFGEGKSMKLIAEALDGSDYISLNFYDLATGPQIAPCEMSADKAIAFVHNYAPEGH